MSGNKKPATVLIRADGSAQIGLGHIMRCIALAQGLLKEGCAPLFISKTLDGASSKILSQYQIQFVSISDSLSEEEDAEATLCIAYEKKARLLVIDNYALGEKFRQRMKKAGLKSLVVDDIAEANTITADIILNQNMGAETYLEKYRAIASDAGQYLLGANYAMFREDILQRGADARSSRASHLNELFIGRKPDLIVTFGGSDVAGLTSVVMKELLNLTDLFQNAFIIIGPGMKNENQINDIQALALQSSQLVILKNPSLADYMARADIAITAGGSTTHELAYFGIAMLIIQAADNQKLICREYKKRAMALVMNWDTPQCALLRNKINKMLSNPDLIAQFSQSCMSAIDGGGVSRIINALTASSA